MAALILIGLALALLAARVWIGLALSAAGLIALLVFKDVDALSALAFSAWSGLNAAELAPLPLFVLMGEGLSRTGLARQMFDALAPLTARLPGGLLQTNVAGCALMAAACGSSAATTATVGRITLSELEARGYDRRLAMGSLCGAGTLGFLIPPSIVLILYGVLAQVSILSLFLAGIVPGLCLAGLFAAYLAWAAPRRRDPPPPLHPGRTLLSLAPLVGLIGLVLGSLYTGLATPTESAVIGVAVAAGLSLRDGSGALAAWAEALRAAVLTSAMIGLVLMGALFLAKVAVYLGLPSALSGLLSGADLPPFALVVILLILFAGLGMVVDGLSLIVMSLPFTAPLAAQAGFDPVWFGIFLVIAVEMGQITPPLGFNLYVVKGLTGEGLGRIAWASLPFFLILAGFALILAAWPGLALWLPQRL